MWGVTKNHVALHRKEYTMAAAAEILLEEGFNKCTAEVWQKATRHAVKIAENYDIDAVDIPLNGRRNYSSCYW